MVTAMIWRTKSPQGGNGARGKKMLRPSNVKPGHEAEALESGRFDGAQS
jgi:hypothetical protein